MFSVRSVVAGLVLLAALSLADTYQLILQGKVQMNDGSAPPATVSIERICSDSQGSAPGPITNKKGEYVWRMEVDPMKTRACFLRAHLDGYVSTQIDISALNSYSNPKLEPLVLTATSGDPTVIAVPESAVPAKAHSAWKAAMKAVDAGNMPEAAGRLQDAVNAAPKFSGGWHALGLVNGMQQKTKEAREAYEHAVSADPKNLPAYVMLARMCVRMKDWQCVANSSDALLKADVKRAYWEIYLHQAVARYQLKDLAGAESSVQETLKRDQAHKMPRAEYVLGRILEAKGDLNGAREHMTSYLKLDPNAADSTIVRGHLENLGKPEASAVEPDLELQ